MLFSIYFVLGFDYNDSYPVVVESAGRNVLFSLFRLFDSRCLLKLTPQNDQLAKESDKESKSWRKEEKEEEVGEKSEQRERLDYGERW